MFEKTISSKRIYKGRMLGLRDDTVELTAGQVSHREICEHPGAVAIIPITHDSKIVLIRQYRKPADEVLIEIPAGLIYPNEDLKSAAVRELEEETGYKTEKIEFIFSIYTSPGYSTEKLHFFIAKDIIKTQTKLDYDENIETEIFQIDEALQMIKTGQIKDSKTIIAIYLVKSL